VIKVRQHWLGYGFGLRVCHRKLFMKWWIYVSLCTCSSINWISFKTFTSFSHAKAFVVFGLFSISPVSKFSQLRTETGPVADMSLFRSEILSGSSQNRQGHLQCSKGRAGPWTNFSNVFDFCGKSLELTGDVWGKLRISRLGFYLSRQVAVTFKRTVFSRFNAGPWITLKRHRKEGIVNKPLRRLFVVK